jgi:hypothetical protein
MPESDSLVGWLYPRSVSPRSDSMIVFVLDIRSCAGLPGRQTGIALRDPARRGFEFVGPVEMSGKMELMR